MILDNLAQLKTKNDFLEVHKSEYYRENFVKKYINDIPRLALEVFGMKLTYQQVEVLEEFSFEGGRLVVPSGHSTGKTRLIGVLTFAFILLFPKSIVRIIAPTEKQVTTFSFKEIRACIDGMKSHRKYKGRVYEGKWSFLSKFFVVNKTLIYVKGYEKEWQIHPATAPLGSPENLAGLHNKYLLLVFDEASGIEDDAIGVALGAVSERVNSAIMFSQHTRTSGKFHNFVTVQNIDNGGVWKLVRLSSEESPRVLSKEILSWKATYDENEYNVKVLGLPPLFEDGFLLNTQKVQKIYTTAGKEWIKELEFSTLTISVDIAFVGLRDSGIIVTMLVATRVNAMGRTVLYVIVKDIQKFQGNNKRTPIKLMRETEKTLVKVSNKYTETSSTKICVDATSGGTEAFNILEERVAESIYSDVDTIPIRWGTGRLVGIDKKRFINQRAKAYIMLKEAIEGNRFYVDTEKEQTRVLKELSHIPFKLDSKFRYQMLSKKEMAQKNISSPDIADAFAQAFLVDYIINEDSNNNNYNDEIEDLEEILEKQTVSYDEEMDTSEEEVNDLISSLIM